MQRVIGVLPGFERQGVARLPGERSFWILARVQRLLGLQSVGEFRRRYWVTSVVPSKPSIQDADFAVSKPATYNVILIADYDASDVSRQYATTGPS